MTIIHDFAKAIENSPWRTEALYNMLDYTPKRDWAYGSARCGIAPQYVFISRSIYRSTRKEMFYCPLQEVMVACRNSLLADALGISSYNKLSILAMYNPRYAGSADYYAPTKRKLPLQALREIPQFFSRKIPPAWIPHALKEARGNFDLQQCILKATNLGEVLGQIKNVKLAAEFFYHSWWWQEGRGVLLNQLPPSLRIPTLVELFWPREMELLDYATTDWYQLFNIPPKAQTYYMDAIKLPSGFCPTRDETHLSSHPNPKHQTVLVQSYDPRDEIFLRRHSTCLYVKKVPQTNAWVTEWHPEINVPVSLKSMNHYFGTKLEVAI